MATAQIRYRPGATLKLVPDRTIRRIVERGQRDEVKLDVHAPEIVEGPIRSGQRLGRVEVQPGRQGRRDGRRWSPQSAVPAAKIAQTHEIWPRAARTWSSASRSPALVATVLLRTPPRPDRAGGGPARPRAA